MSALDSITASLARDRQSKPWQAFVKQNPGVAPLVVAYLDGGARPTDAQLGQNHYAHARVQAEDARRALAPIASTGGKHVSTHEQQDYRSAMEYGKGDYLLCGEWAARQASADLSIDVYAYSSGLTGRDAYWTGLSGARIVQAGYELRSSSNAILKNAGYQGAGTDGVVGNPGHQGYRNEWVQTVLQRIRDVDGAAGVFIDDLAQSTHILSGTPAAYPTQTAWRAVMEDFVADVSQRLAAGGLKIMFNLGAWWPGHGQNGKPNYDNGDATKDWGTIEGTAGHKVMVENGFQTIDNIPGTTRLMGSGWHQNWDGWASVIPHFESKGIDWVGMADAPAGDSATAIYLKASALLWQNRPGSSTMFRVDNHGTSQYSGSKLAADLGAPLGPATLSGQTWTRRFASGVVTVNPHTGAASIT